MPSGTLVYGKVFRQGKRLVRYGYRSGTKVGLYAYSAARTYNKARYVARQYSHAQTLIKSFKKKR
jgi:hypothetical protein